MAEAIDALHLVARVAGQNWPKGKIPDIPPAWRPGETTTQPKKKRTVAELWQIFQRK
jgi:hypothetical protein